MKRIKNFIKNYSLGIILGVLFLSIVTVYAATILQAKDLKFSSANVSSLSSDITVQAALEDLYKKDFCPSGYRCYKTHTTPVVGDYVKMTPTLTSFTTDTAKTGYTSTQTINPSELNLWRVIRINSDGTIEMVSEYVSSDVIYFKGQTGYKNFVGYLNEIASKYENNKYTIGSRHMGYNGQTEYLIDTANTVDSTATTPPWTSSTGTSTVESQGGGDRLYETDTNLVKTAVGTLIAKTVSGSEAYYWLASRYYNYSSSTYWRYRGRFIVESGILNNRDLYGYLSGFGASAGSSAVRPIVVLKSGISYTEALGTIDDPFILE